MIMKSQDWNRIKKIVKKIAVLKVSKVIAFDDEIDE